MVPVLLILSGVKFATVVAYFMHLRFESGLLTRLFTGSFLLGAFVLTALALLFWNNATR